MGIPKFFRYISERYPLISQIIQENKIPEFDNLYVDFNGIIHNCSHPNDEDAHFRLSEEQIFTSIFAYVDYLFGKIKPKKLFFMAVDGVAPRAKMNQQRSRRFRTAKEAEEVRLKAERKGEILPEEKAFDSNCITPGTPFMARLSEQLKYFVNKKITEDADWAGVEVVLSGHEVPGEGEHKIMEYIRHAKAQPRYNANTRHCLYGLDADLIMLGLLSHDPHFCLLREEVKFGPAARKKNTNLQSQNFFLLHLCLLREYLDMEFQDIEPQLSFPYNLERIIDDFVLLAVFVGNDFLPNLPDLHIHDNALERLFNIYKSILSQAGGYINNSGVIDVQRLQLVLNALSESEVEVFHKEMGDVNWVKSKKKAPPPERRMGSLHMTQKQNDMFKTIRKAVHSHRREEIDEDTPVTFPNDLGAGDKRFITTLAAELNLTLAWDEFDEDQNVVSLYFPPRRPPAPVLGSGDDEGESEDSSEDDEAIQESNAAIDRVLNRYMNAGAVEDGEEEFEKREVARLKEKMDEWKREYYKDKLEISYDDRPAVRNVVYRWVEGLQWVMFYYYSGVASWGWFYNYHYSPRITDFTDIDQMSFEFELGTPFKPYQQLMGVLPEASKEQIPLAYRDLMSTAESPILDFYPKEFETDLNGKKQEWEAVVKIPFLNQTRLLKAMAERDHRLTAEEVKRNSFGESTRFTFDPNQDIVYPSSLPGFFPTIAHSRCRMETFHLPTLDGLHLVEGLCDGVFLGSAALAGFPSLKTLPYSGRLDYHHVNVFQSESKNQTMVIEIDNDAYEGKGAAEIAEVMVGKKTYIGWPFLQEGLVVAVSDEMFRHEMRPFGVGQESLAGQPHPSMELTNWRRNATRIEQVYSKRFAVVTGPVKLLLHVRPLKGLKRLDTGALVKDYEGRDKEVEQAVQLGLQEVISEDPRYVEQAAPPMAEEFPIGSRIIFLGEHAYGVAAQVTDTKEDSLTIVIAFFPGENTENDSFTKIVLTRLPARYYQSYDAASAIGISGLALSKITSSFMVLGTDNSKTNLGLCLKYEAKGLKVMGYTRKGGRSWEYSDKAVDLVREYQARFPEIFRSLNDRKDDMLRASDVFRQSNPDAKIKEVRSWLNSKGVKDFEPVPLAADQLKKDVVAEVEKLADSLASSKSATSIKKAKVQGIPRQAVLKPAHAVYRLQNQRFALGDRVIMVQDSGSVPLAAKGVVVGLNVDSIDIVWDVPFISGTTLGGRCSEYHGSTMPMNSCLNLTNRQYVTSTKPQPKELHPAPIVRRGATGLRGRGGHNVSTPSIMRNPNRHPGGRGAAPLPNPIIARNGVPSYGSALKDDRPKSASPPPSHTENLVNALRLDDASVSHHQSALDTRGQGRGRGRGRGSNSRGAPQNATRGLFNARGRGVPFATPGGRGTRGSHHRGRGRGRGAQQNRDGPDSINVTAQ